MQNQKVNGDNTKAPNYTGNETAAFNLDKTGTHTIKMPSPEKFYHYREVLANHILAKLLGSTTVLKVGETYHIETTRENAIKIQALLDSTIGDADELIEHLTFSLIRRNGLLMPADIDFKVANLSE